MKNRTILLLGTSLFLGACQSSDAGKPVTQYLGDYEGHVATFQAELSAHGAEIHATGSLAGMMTMEDKHAAGATMHLESMGADMDHMAMCTDESGHMPDMGSMDELGASAMHECEQHNAAMHAAGDMMAAMKEEDHHQATMAGILDMMDKAQKHMTDQEMMAGGGMHMCGSSGDSMGDGSMGHGHGM